MEKKSGYILVFTMIMMAALSAIVVYIFNRGMTAIPLIAIALEREKAKMVAFSGVEIARSLIVGPQNQQTKETKKAGTQEAVAKKQDAQSNNQQEKQNPDQQFLQHILPRLGRWSTYELKASVDGVDGQLQLCITCEDGKINLNTIYDFNKHAFMGQNVQVGNWKTMLETLLKTVGATTKTADLFPSLEAFLKKQQGPLEDVTQLLLIPAFAPFANILYVPCPKEQNKDIVPAIALTDLFTLYGNTAGLEPWLFSTSVQLACGIKVNTTTFKQRTKDVMQWTKNFKPSPQWKTDWNITLKNMYEKELGALPKGLDSFFVGTFKPTFFGVLVQATVGRVTQKIYAIIERTRRSHNNQIVYDSIVRKWYIV
ncbi:hypothetical protein EKK58_10845 [Candidatus Dependentiae bacterium]|nr:MAG: hypothetical protein EKK58_10845 [Candidatus Dependentiae bacterium]